MKNNNSRTKQTSIETSLPNAPGAQAQSPTSTFSREFEQYLENTMDHVGRVRAAKEAAQRLMETFGDVSEYEICKIYGQKKTDESPVEYPQLNLPGTNPKEG